MTLNASASTSWHTGPFAGRHHERAVLSGLLDDVHRSGVGRLVVVSGGAGSGKSRLCAELAAEAREHRIRTCWSIADPLAQCPALGTWRYALDRLVADPASTATTLAADLTRWDLFNSALDLLDAITVPTVLVLDDLHRADPDTLAFTRFAASALQGLPLLVVAGWRTSTDSGDALRRLTDVASEVVTELPLDPLAADDVRTLLHRPGADALDATAIDEIVHLSAGSPLLAVELAQRHRRGSDLHVAARDLFRHALADLTASSRSIGETVALSKGAASVSFLAAVTADSEQRVRNAVSASHGTLVLDGDVVRFRHDLFAEAATETIGADRAIEIHLRAAEVAMSLPQSEVVSAEHLLAAFRLGADVGGPLATASSRAADRLWRDLAWRRALDWFARAAELAHAAELADRWRWSLQHAQALQRCGFLAASRDVFQLVTRGTEDPALVADATLGAAGIWVEEQRDPVDRAVMLEACASSIDRIGDTHPVRCAELAVRLSAEQCYDGGAIGPVIAAVDELRACGDDPALARSLSLLHHCLLGPGDAERRFEVAEEMMSAAVRSGEEFQATLALLWHTVDLYLAGDPTAESTFAQLRRRVRSLHIESLEYIVDLIDVMRLIRSGRLDEAEAAAGAAFEMGNVAGDADALGYFVGQIGCIRWLQGRLTEMEGPIRDVLESGTLRNHDVVYPAILSMIRAQLGDFDEARSIAHGVMTSHCERSEQMSTWTTVLAALAEYAVAAHDTEVATWLIEQIRPNPHLVVMPSLAIACLGPIARSMGLAELTLGRVDESVSWLRRAQTENRRLRNHPVAIAIDRDLTRALVASNSAHDRAEAVDLEREARRHAVDLGISALFSDTATMATTSETRLRVGRLARLDSHWEGSLTNEAFSRPHSIGLEYLAILLSNPGVEVSSIELSDMVHGLRPSASTASDDVLDARSIATYRARLDSIDVELDRADRRGDSPRSSSLLAEQAAILKTLSGATGLSSRRRRLGDESERARGRVSAALRRTLRSITEVAPKLGLELTSAIRLGSHCVYVPHPALPIDWTVERR